MLERVIFDIETGETTRVAIRWVVSPSGEVSDILATDPLPTGYTDYVPPTED